MSPRNFWKKNNGGNSKPGHWNHVGHVHFTREVQRCVGTRLGLGLAQLFGQLLLNLMAVPDSSQQFPTFNAQLYKSDREESGTVWNMNNNI